MGDVPHISIDSIFDIPFDDSQLHIAIYPNDHCGNHDCLFRDYKQGRKKTICERCFSNTPGPR